MCLGFNFSSKKTRKQISGRVSLGLDYMKQNRTANYITFEKLSLKLVFLSMIFSFYFLHKPVSLMLFILYVKIRTFNSFSISTFSCNCRTLFT